MNDDQRAQQFWDHVANGHYMDALSAVWDIDKIHDYSWLLSQTHVPYPSSRMFEVVSAACREAVQRVRTDTSQLTTVTTWLEKRRTHQVPSVLVECDSDEEALQYRERLLHACLRVAEVAIDANWITHAILETALEPLGAETGFAPGFLRLLADSFLLDTGELAIPQTAVRQETIIVFLVRGEEGIPVRLTVTLIRPGHGHCYPDLNTAWLYRSQSFDKAITNAWTIVTAQPGQARDFDVRWRLDPYDSDLHINAVEGPSMGAAVGVVLAVLLARAGIALPGSLQHQAIAADLYQVGITASLDDTENLGAIGGLWAKIGEKPVDLVNRGLLRLILVAAKQDGVPPEYERENAQPFRVVRAASLEETLRRLAEFSASWQAVLREERKQCEDLDILGSNHPLASHYQLTPLLREVKKEKLPRDRERPGEEDEDSSMTMRRLDIHRWEEQIREEDIAYEEVELDHVLCNFHTVAPQPSGATPRFVVLGPPGSGKTTLGQYVGGRIANGSLQLHDRRYLPVRVRLRLWQAWANANPSSSDLASYLTDQYSALTDAPTITHWRQWLQRSDVWLFLDGLDEIASAPSRLKIGIALAIPLNKIKGLETWQPQN